MGHVTGPTICRLQMNWRWRFISYILEEDDDAIEGYIFEVNMEYPHHLHDLHNEYPLLSPRTLKYQRINANYTKQMIEERKVCLSTKLTPNLCDKSNYVTHHCNLQYYLQEGLILAKINKILQFKHAPWLKKYIDFNTKKHMDSKPPFKKDFFKLLNNALFGKIIKNLRNRRNIE